MNGATMKVPARTRPTKERKNEAVETSRVERVTGRSRFQKSAVAILPVSHVPSFAPWRSDGVAAPISRPIHRSTSARAGTVM